MPVYSYRRDVLERLARHGVRPTSQTSPELVHEFVSDLYRLELRRLRVKSICLGSYIPWDVKRQVEIIKTELGWKGDEVEGHSAESCSGDEHGAPRTFEDPEDAGDQQRDREQEADVAEHRHGPRRFDPPAPERRATDHDPKELVVRDVLGRVAVDRHEPPVAHDLLDDPDEHEKGDRRHREQGASNSRSGFRHWLPVSRIRTVPPVRGPGVTRRVSPHRAG